VLRGASRPWAALDDDELRRRFAAERVARLASVRPDGGPHLVPITFAVDGDTVFTVVDAKPKRTRRLQRLDNLRSQPRCSVLVDHYDDDWSQLWWVRADGVAAVIDAPGPAHGGLVLLADRYPAYGAAPPTGPLIVVTVTRWSGWSAI
jgi:PPOX class probable F420-dependent enzyme